MQFACSLSARSGSSPETLYEPSVPKHDGAGAIVAGGNGAFEFAIIDGVIFDFDGEPAVAVFRGKTFGHGPGFQDAVHFEAEIVVQAGGIMFLHDEEGSGGLLWRLTLPAGSCVRRKLRLALYSLRPMGLQKARNFKLQAPEKLQIPNAQFFERGKFRVARWGALSPARRRLSGIARVAHPLTVVWRAGDSAPCLVEIFRASWKQGRSDGLHTSFQPCAQFTRFL